MEEEIKNYKLFDKEIPVYRSGYTAEIPGYYFQVAPINWNRQLRSFVQWVDYRAHYDRTNVNKRDSIREGMRLLSEIRADIMKDMPQHVVEMIKTYKSLHIKETLHPNWLRSTSAYHLTGPVARAIAGNRGYMAHYVYATENGHNIRKVTRCLRDDKLEELFGGVHQSNKDVIVETLKRWPAGMTIDHIGRIPLMMHHIVEPPRTKLDWAVLVASTILAGAATKEFRSYVKSRDGARKLLALVEAGQKDSVPMLVDRILNSHLYTSEQYKHAPVEHIPSTLLPFTSRTIASINNYIGADETSLCGSDADYGW